MMLVFELMKSIDDGMIPEYFTPALSVTLMMNVVLSQTFKIFLSGLLIWIL